VKVGYQRVVVAFAIFSVAGDVGCFLLWLLWFLLLSFAFSSSSTSSFSFFYTLLLPSAFARTSQMLFAVIATGGLVDSGSLQKLLMKCGTLMSEGDLTVQMVELNFAKVSACVLVKFCLIPRVV
jgi:hypothetical protein